MGSDAAETPPARRISMALRLLGARTAGLSLGAVAVGAVMLEQHRAPVWFGLLAANALLWPLVAYRLTARASRPPRQESLNLVVDSALGGVWIAAMNGVTRSRASAWIRPGPPNGTPSVITG